jgi:hypothetical protein
MKAQENTIEQTLKSFDLVQRLEVPSGLQCTINNNFNSNKVITMSGNQKWMLAASILVLLGLNLITIIQYSKTTNNSSSNQEKNIVYHEYFTNIHE